MNHDVKFHDTLTFVNDNPEYDTPVDNEQDYLTFNVPRTKVKHKQRREHHRKLKGTRFIKLAYPYTETTQHSSEDSESVKLSKHKTDKYKFNYTALLEVE